MHWFSQFAQEALTVILGQGYALCILGGCVAGIVTMILPRWIRRRLLERTIEQAYMALRNVCEPLTLNPECMKSHARDLVNAMLGRLRRANLHPPDRCDRSDESFAEWFAFLGRLREDLSQERAKTEDERHFLVAIPA